MSEKMAYPDEIEYVQIVWKDDKKRLVVDLKNGDTYELEEKGIVKQMENLIECELRTRDKRRRNEETVGTIFLKTAPRRGEDLEIMDANAETPTNYTVSEVKHVVSVDGAFHKIILYV